MDEDIVLKTIPEVEDALEDDSDGALSFLEDAIDSDIDRRKFGGEEPINFAPAFDPILKIASLLNIGADNNGNNGVTEVPHNIVLGNLLKSYRPEALQANNGHLRSLDLGELSVMALVAEASRSLNIRAGINGFQAANDYTQKIAADFGTNLTNLRNAVQDKEDKKGNTENKRTKKILPEAEPILAPEGQGMPGHFSVSSGALLAAKLAYKHLQGFDARLRGIKTFEELARLTAINSCSDLLNEKEAHDLRKQANMPGSDLEYLALKAFASVAIKNNNIAAMTADRAVDSYIRIINSKISIGRYLSKELQEIAAVKTDYEAISRRITDRTQLEKGLVMKMPRIRTEQELEAFKRKVEARNIELFEFAEPGTKIHEIEEKYVNINQEMEAKLKQALEKIDDDLNYRKYIVQLTRNVNAAFKTKVQIDDKYTDKTNFRKRVSQLEEQVLLALEDIQQYFDPKWLVGDSVKVVKANGLDMDDSFVAGERPYLFGGDTGDLPLGSVGKIREVLQDYLVVESGDLKNTTSWVLHRDEVENLEARTQETIKIDPVANRKRAASAEIKRQADALLQDFTTAAIEGMQARHNLGVQNMALEKEYEIAQAKDNIYKQGDMVVIAKCLGPDGKYKSEDYVLREKDRPIGTVAKIENRHGQGFWSVDFGAGFAEAYLHADEIRLLKRIGGIKGDFDLGAKVESISDNYTLTRKGSWGFIKGTDDYDKNAYLIEWHHLTGNDLFGQPRGTPVNFAVAKKDVKIIEVAPGEQAKADELEQNPETRLAGVEQIIEECERDAVALRERKSSTINNGAAMLRSLGVDEGVINLFFARYLTADDFKAFGVLPQKSTFTELTQLTNSIDYKKLISQLFHQVRDTAKIAFGIDESTIQNSQTGFEETVKKIMAMDYPMYVITPDAKPGKGDLAVARLAGEGAMHYANGLTIGNLPPGRVGYLYKHDYFKSFRYDYNNGIANMIDNGELVKVVPFAEELKLEGEFAVGSRVYIKPGTRYQNDTMMTGTIYYVQPETIRIKFDDEYQDTYEKPDLAMVIPATMNPADKKRFEEYKNRFTGLIQKAVDDVRAMPAATNAKIEDMAATFVDTMRSLGLQDEEIIGIIKQKAAGYVRQNLIKKLA